MEEIKPIKNDAAIKKSLDILKKCQDEVYKRMSQIIMESMENPLNDKVDDEAIAVYMSLIAVECLMELARTGYDMLGQVNDKDSAIKTVLKANGITIEQF